MVVSCMVDTGARRKAPLEALITFGFCDVWSWRGSLAHTRGQALGETTRRVLKGSTL